MRRSAAMIRDGSRGRCRRHRRNLCASCAARDGVLRHAPPSADDTRAKIRRISDAGWPFLVAEQDGQIVGYAYATQFRDRAAYAWTCENSIYVHPDWQGRGIGTALLQELCRSAEDFGFRQMVAVIGGAEPASIALHAACGFRGGRAAPVGGLEARPLARQCLHAAGAGKGLERAAAV